MVRTTILAALLACGAGCDEHGKSPAGDARVFGDAALMTICASPGMTSKLSFSRATSCQNDGSVEFCLPDQPELLDRVAKIAPTARCAPGGGRAGCNVLPGQLLCTFPTRFPDECLQVHGAMNDAAWIQTCELTEIDEVKVIVPTVVE